MQQGSLMALQPLSRAQHRAAVLSLQIADAISSTINSLMGEDGRFSSEDDLYFEYNDIFLVIELIQERDALFDKGLAHRLRPDEILGNPHEGN